MLEMKDSKAEAIWTEVPDKPTIGPIYTVRLCRMREAYGRPTTGLGHELTSVFYASVLY